MRKTATRRVAMLGLLVLLAAPTARGEDRECPTWFPDFGDCGRAGRYAGFTAPVGAPYLFEDPFITTGASLWGIWNQFPNSSIFMGGHAWVLALQLRLALTDRLGFFASKDGYAWHRPGNPILSNEDGLYDLGFGFKYALIDDRERNFILTPNLRFDVPTGKNRVYQGNGDGVIQPGVSTAFGEGNFHTIANLGFRIPFNLDKESSSVFYNVHFDYRLWEFLAPFIEFNGYTYLSGGDGTRQLKTTLGTLTVAQAQAALATGPFEALDVANLGSTGVGGKTIVTTALGARIPVDRHASVGLAYEVPITNRRDVLSQRVTMNFQLEF